MPQAAPWKVCAPGAVVACIGVLLARGVCAQKVGFATVTVAARGEHVTSMMPYQRAAALGRDGAWYLLVSRTSGRDDPPDSELELWRSPGGADWRLAATTPIDGDVGGTIVADPAFGQLHVLWAARGDAGFASVYHGVFDLAAQRWRGAPALLARGAGDEDQYAAQDLCVSGGTLVAAIGSHRRPKAGLAPWSTGLRLLPPGAEEWTAIEQVNVGNSGVWGDLAEHGVEVRSSYRTFDSRGPCIATRTYDVVQRRFVEPGDVRVAPTGDLQLSNANSSLTLVDQLGNRWVMLVLGEGQAGAGRIVAAYAPVGDDTWATVDLCADPVQRGGNYNPRHLALARGPGNQVLAFYSRQAEQCATLYLQVLEAGRSVVGERAIERGGPHAFDRLSGVRQQLPRVGVQLVVSAGGEQSAAGWPAGSEVRVYGLLR